MPHMTDGGASGLRQEAPKADAATIAAKLEQARADHLGGQPARAAMLCREILTESPAQPEALHLLGVVELQGDNAEAAVELIGRAIELAPDNAVSHLDLGLALVALKRPAEAQASFQRALALRPDYVKAFTLHLLGVMEIKKDNAATAVDLLGRAAGLDPDNAAAHLDLGLALSGLRRPAEALASFERALALRPDYAKAHFNRGNTLRDLGRTGEALASYERALALRSGYVEALNNRGGALLESGRAEAALESYDRVLALKPDHVQALNNRGNALLALKRSEEALASYERALALAPEYAQALVNRGNALVNLDRAAEALASYERALALEPENAEAFNNRGNALLALKRSEEALASYERALAHRPGYVEALSNRGNVLFALRRPAEALASHQHALALEPEHAGAHWNEALCRLLLGDFETGWRKYEWRWKDQLKDFRREFAQPLWLGGEALQGKTILLHAEQGLGDTIQFCRYAKRVAALGATVLLEVQPALMKLLAGLQGVSRLLARGEALPAFDCQCPLLSLPFALDTRLDTVPREIPYLDAPPELVLGWKEKLSGFDGFRIGIGWQGKSDSRSVPLARFAGLARIPGVHLISLQKGAGAEQLDEVRDRFRIIDFADDLDRESGAFMDTAAIMRNLDLVLACDSAIVHLAGALGVPVWVALAFAPEWRWLLERNDSPWYPTMRLFRQPKAGDWKSVFDEIERALRTRLGEGS